MIKINLFLIAFFSVFLAPLKFSAGDFPAVLTGDNAPKPRPTHAALEGKPMPALDPSNWINGEVKPADMKGKVVIVDFYATWSALAWQPFRTTTNCSTNTRTRD